MVLTAANLFADGLGCKFAAETYNNKVFGTVPIAANKYFADIRTSRGDLVSQAAEEVKQINSTRAPFIVKVREEKNNLF